MTDCGPACEAGRYVLVLGHSLKLSNGAFLASAGVDMVMLTYADSGLSAATRGALESVGWQIREVGQAYLSPTLYDSPNDGEMWVPTQVSTLFSECLL